MSLPDISDGDLNLLIADALKTVFETMLSLDCVQVGSEDYSGERPPLPDFDDTEENSIYVGSVGFVGGVNGMIYLYVKSHFADEAAKRITGLEDSDLDYEIISDVCGELTNMFAGSFKNKLADMSHESMLTTPTVLSGDELFLSTMGVVKHLRQRFRCGSDDVTADLVLAESMAVA